MGDALVRRTSSLSLNPVTKNSIPTPCGRPLLKSGSGIVIPDSQEVIDIVDSEDEFFEKERAPSQQPARSAGSQVSGLTPRRYKSKSLKHGSPTASSVTEAESTEDEDTQPRYIHKTPITPRIRRTVVSGSESESETEPDDEEINFKPGDNGVLVYDPPSSSKPVRRPAQVSMEPLSSSAVLPTPGGGKETIASPSPLGATGPSTSKMPPMKQSKMLDFLTPTRQKGRERQADVEEAPPTMFGTPSYTSTSQRPKATTAGTGRGKSPIKRKTKKQIEQEKQEQLSSYAQELFNELNASVFKNGLPATTAIVWNKRLAQTAGRAKWHIDRNNNETTTIELSTKVIESEERVRYTLAHEMCHLASWYINKQPRENHGAIWKSWTKKVMSKRPDIEISTRHKYEITYKYRWQCTEERCKQEYGRHSKSIDPQKFVCGACKMGQLIPLHTSRTRIEKDKVERISNMLSAKPRESPISALRARVNSNNVSAASPPFTPPRSYFRASSIIEISSDSESDCGDVRNKLASEFGNDGVTLVETPYGDDEDMDESKERTVNSTETDNRSPMEVEKDIGSILKTETEADIQIEALQTQMTVIDLTDD